MRDRWIFKINWFRERLFFYSDYFLFVLLLMFKTYLLADLTGTVFYEYGVWGYIKNLFAFIFGGGSFNTIRSGLLMISLGYILLLSFWTLFFTRRKRIYILIILNALVSFVLFADVIHYRYFDGFISVALLLQAGQVGNLTDSIISLIQLKDILFWVDVFLTIPLFIFIWKKKWFAEKKRAIVAGILAFVIGWFCVQQPLHVFYQYGGKKILEKMIASESIYKFTGIYGYHFFDMKRNFEDYVLHKKRVSKERANEIDEWFSTNTGKTSPETFGIAEGKNLIVVQLEAIQDFVINREVEGQEITPYLNELIKDSAYFPNFYHQAAQGRTSDADLLVNTSLYPLATGSAFIRYSANEYDSISKVLKDDGYQATAHHAFKGSFWNRNSMYSSLEYDQFYSKEDYQPEETIGWGASDEDFFRQTVDMMPADKPFYSFMISLTSHHPYPMPKKHKVLNLDNVENELLENYLHSVHYVDQSIKVFVEELKQKGLWENSVVVFYGDHDAKVMEQGTNSETFVTGDKNEFELYKEYDQVPLVIHLPEDQLAGTYEKTGGQLHLAPTLLHMLGHETNDKYFMGKDLFLEGNRLVALRTGSVTNGKVWYQQAKDGIFSNGTCYEFETGKKIDIKECSSIYEEAQQQYRISDDIIFGNLIKKFK
ncbi:LTA synthase family protein [Pseudalkalibacillus berkeleyi]|uniref:LTA synthase family protein n=1 Tax=Pseudalkalibacillus berkeleyi TaxID=1069813 RepID=A0ABS9H4H0_9BACL|nr:LTA synthase family protein [Pseudalkalibacillus berkeleyi]MCF6138816.1 LTA synthase family protein [Pseudalkalibacillus berkeleyi]